MAKKQFVDKDGRKFVEVTPWYKQWWSWVLAVAAIILMISLIGGSKDRSESKADQSSEVTAHNTTDIEKGTSESTSAKKASPSVTVDDEKYAISDKKAYKVNYSDSNWAPAKIGVDKVTVYKLAKPHQFESSEDGKFNIEGYVRLHFSVSPTRDINAYPTMGTVIYSNGEQDDADAPEGWDGEIARGATKAGDVTLPIQKLNSAGSLKTLRYKFDTDYETDNDDDENSDHTYDFTLNFK